MKRWTLRILILLFLGAIVNVAVAWGCAYWLPCAKKQQVNATIVRLDDPEWVATVDRVWAFGCMQQEIGVKLPSVDPPDHSTARIAWTTPGHPPTRIVIRTRNESWSQLGPRMATGEKSVFLGEIAAGLPYKSLWGCTLEYLPDLREFRDRPFASLPFPARSNAMPDPHSPIAAAPLKPIWPGFAINTVFYAAILFALGFGFVQGRRIIRLRRGRCPKCAYDLRGCESGACPECGWRRPS